MQLALPCPQGSEIVGRDSAAEALPSQHGKDAPSRRSLRALDALNFFLADVRDGIGPYLAVYLLSVQNWDSTRIGIALSAVGVATTLAQTPAGAIVDSCRRKRGMVVLSALVVGAATCAMVWAPSFGVILAGQVLTGIAAAFLAPAITALTLGLVGAKHFDRTMGRTQGFNHAGNVAAAALAGLLGSTWGPQWVFFFVAAMAVASSLCAVLIRGDDIDDAVARGAGRDAEHTEIATGLGSLRVVFTDRRLLALAAAIALFHLANAAMLPIAGQRLALFDRDKSTLTMSACIIVAQAVMIPASVAAGRLVRRIGCRPILAVAFGALVARGWLYLLGGRPALLLGLQLFDGVGAGVCDVIVPIYVARLMHGTGRFNLAAGALATATMIGASLSTLVAGCVIDAAGYPAAFAVLASLATVAAGVLWFCVPELDSEVSATDRRRLEAARA